MALSPKGNVVPLDDHPRAKARLSKKESADVLAGCRQLALDRIRGALSGMLDRVEDDLFELAEKAIDREAQNAYLDARAQAREKRTQIEATFSSHFTDFFDRKVRGDAPATTQAGEGELSLVGHEDLEERIAVSEMSRKLKAACEGELVALSQRMGFLLERPEMEDDANPMSPATICAALKDACDQIEAGFKVRMTLLHQLESYVEADLQSVYHDLNSHLVARSILPDVRVGIRRAAGPQAAPKRPKAAPKAVGGMPAAPGGREDGNILAALAQLLGNSQAVGGAAAGPAGMMAPGSAPAWPTAAGGAPTVPTSFVSELTRMHREAGTAMASDEAALQNVVRRIKSAPQSATLGTVDAMTIDIVAMLFDYIFEDRHIPASVKALLGRLQIPTLKVALLDKSFFSSKSHPARRLLDLLAEAALGLDESVARAHPALELIEDVVDRVLEEFETDVTLFESLATRVAAFIEERSKAETDVVERSARLVEERERDEIARVVAEEEVARHLATRAWVPPAVREMLDQTWVRALASVQRTEGEKSPTWQSLVMTMDELLWSVEPKTSPDDRKRLITMLPGMLKHMIDGLDRGGLAEADRTVFLGTLVDCHAVAVKAGLRGLAAVPEQPAPEKKAPQRPSIAREMVPAGDIQVEEIRLRSPKGTLAVRNVFTRTGIWTNLQRGTWVEFARAEGVATRARLTWISPNKGVYLFTNPLSTTAAVSISPEALAEQMRVGEARIIDDASLVDRAVDTMLADLKEAQG